MAIPSKITPHLQRYFGPSSGIYNPENASYAGPITGTAAGTPSPFVASPPPTNLLSAFRPGASPFVISPPVAAPRPLLGGLLPAMPAFSGPPPRPAMPAVRPTQAPSPFGSRPHPIIMDLIRGQLQGGGGMDIMALLAAIRSRLGMPGQASRPRPFAGSGGGATGTPRQPAEPPLLGENLLAKMDQPSGLLGFGGGGR